MFKYVSVQNYSAQNAFESNFQEFTSLSLYLHTIEFVNNIKTKSKRIALKKTLLSIPNSLCTGSTHNTVCLV